MKTDWVTTDNSYVSARYVGPRWMAKIIIVTENKKIPKIIGKLVYYASVIFGAKIEYKPKKIDFS